MDCAMRAEAIYLQGLRLPSTPPALIGTAVHASTAAFDQAVLDEAPITVDDATEVAVEALANPEEEVDWTGVKYQSAEEAAIKAHVRYCTEVAPQMTYSHVELSFGDLHVDMGDGVEFLLTGTGDRVYLDDQGLAGMADIKTGGAAVSASGFVQTKKHKLQLGQYTVLAEAELGIPLEADALIIGINTKGDAVAGVGNVPDAKAALVGTADGAPGFLHYVKSMVQTGLFPPNPSSNLCTPKYCPLFFKCRYRG
jgi:hypothetical protein